MFFDYIIFLQSQIDISNGNNWSSTFEMLGQFFFLIVIFAAILFLAFFSTKKLASFKMNGRGGAGMKIIETMAVGSQNSVQLIKIGKKYFLIGVSKENISFLAEINECDIPVREEKEKKTEKFPFEKYLQDYFGKRKK